MIIGPTVGHLQMLANVYKWVNVRIWKSGGLEPSWILSPFEIRSFVSVGVAGSLSFL